MPLRNGRDNAMMGEMPSSRADVKVGFACNNRCLFCAQGHKREGCAHVPFEEMVERLQKGRETSDELVLTGGEPTIHPRLLDVIRRAKELGYRQIQVQTNGRMLGYAKFVDELVAAGATEFSPALHGPVAEVHDSLTRAPGSYRQTVAGIRNLRARGLPIITNSVVVKANTVHIPALIELLARLGVSQAQLAFVHPVGTAFELFDEVVPRLSDVVEPIRTARHIARKLGMVLVTEAVPFCFLRGMEELAVEDRIPKTTVIDLDGQPFDYSTWRPAEGKSHGPPCERCIERPRCEGPWREYPAKYGWDEFVPIEQRAS